MDQNLHTTEEGSRRLGIGFELGIVLVREERNELLRDVLQGLRRVAIQVRVGAQQESCAVAGSAAERERLSRFGTRRGAETAVMLLAST